MTRAVEREKAARAVIRGLKCSACERSPSEKEQEQMWDNFGHQLSVRPLRQGEAMIWNCNHCYQDGPSN